MRLIGFVAAMSAAAAATTVFAQGLQFPSKSPSSSAGNVAKDAGKAPPKGPGKLIEIKITIRGSGKVLSDGHPFCNGPVQPPTAANAKSEIKCKPLLLPVGKPLNLTGVPSPGWKLSLWSTFSHGPQCSGGPMAATCTSREPIEGSLIASFDPDPAGMPNSGGAVTVAIPDAGGKVATAPFAPVTINCANGGQGATGNCKATLKSGGSIELIATPDATRSFLGWSGAAGCDKQQKCTVKPAGPMTVTAKFGASDAKLTITTQPVALAFNGHAYPVKGKLARADGTPVVGPTVRFTLGEYGSCQSATTIGGSFACSIKITTTDPNLAASMRGKTLSISVSYVPDGAAIPLVGAKPITVVDEKGTQDKISALLVGAAINKAVPGGILLHNYKKGSGNDPAARQQTFGGRVYLNKELKESQSVKIDVPFTAQPPYHYYMNKVLVRLGTPTVKGPANLVLPLSISGHNGEGPTLWGFCLEKDFSDKLKCAAGDDSSAPDFTNLSMTGTIELAFKVEPGGNVAIVFVGSTAKLDFVCGGVTAMPGICDLIKDFVNLQITSQLAQVVNNQILKDNVRTAFKQLVDSRGKISELKSIELDAQGNLILTGTPKLGAQPNPG